MERHKNETGETSRWVKDRLYNYVEPEPLASCEYGVCQSAAQPWRVETQGSLGLAGWPGQSNRQDPGHQQ